MVINYILSMELKHQPTEKEYETINDSPDAITFSWDITTTPVPVTGFKPTSTC